MYTTTITIIFIYYCTLVALQSQQVTNRESLSATSSEYVPASIIEREVSYYTGKGTKRKSKYNCFMSYGY